MRISQKISSVQTPPHREYPDIWPTWGRACPKEEQDFKPSAAPLAYEKTAFRGVQLLHYHWFAFRLFCHLCFWSLKDAMWL